jgi:quinol monooxygenase YgiN
MYTLVIEASFKPDKKPEFLDYWKNQILPAEKQQNGFVDELLLFANDNPLQGLGLSFWESRQQAEEYYRNVFPGLAAAVEPLCEKQPAVRQYHVEVAESLDISAEEAA